jgi:dihydrofolate reductase
MSDVDVIYHAASSLDGFIATPDGGVDWLDSFQGAGEDHGIAAFFSSVDGLLMGSRTYEFALAHPPWMAPDKTSWVFTTRDLEIAHPRVILTADAPSAVVEQARQRGARRLWMMGGGEIAAAFRADGLITELMLAIIPVVLGDGVPLFARSASIDEYKLVDSKTYPSGIVTLTYRSTPAG